MKTSEQIKDCNMLGFLIVIISGVAAAVFATKGLHSSGWGIFFGVFLRFFCDFSETTVNLRH